MPVGNVSFGRVIGLTGKLHAVEKMNRRLKPLVNSGKVLSYHVTDKYKNQLSITGSLSAAVGRGEEAYVYVTGYDVHKVKEKQNGWDSLDNILGNMSQYINLNKTRVKEAFDMIV